MQPDDIWGAGDRTKRMSPAMPNKRPDPENDASVWRLDRNVPLTVLLAILIQSGGALWWASGISERTNVLEKHEQQIISRGERLARLEANVESIKEGVEDLRTIIRPKYTKQEQ